MRNYLAPLSKDGVIGDLPNISHIKLFLGQVFFTIIQLFIQYIELFQLQKFREREMSAAEKCIQKHYSSYVKSVTIFQFVTIIEDRILDISFMF